MSSPARGCTWKAQDLGWLGPPLGESADRGSKVPMAAGHASVWLNPVNQPTHLSTILIYNDAPHLV
jgi:hypothetical protein